MSEQEHLLTEQYRTPANLEARIAIHRFSTNTYGWMRWAFDQMDLPAEARVLEVGCGIGALWAENSARVLPGWRLTLTDMSRGMVAAAASKPGRRYQLARALAEALPFRPESFDAVVANHMLYHVPDRERAYREFQRVLAPGGTLYAATNGRAHMRELDEMMRSVAGGAALEPLSFTLESGGKELRRQFPTVELRLYEDSLAVPDAQVIVDYALSGPWGMEVGDRAERLRQLAEREIRNKGAVRITKAAGMFVARK